MKKLFALLFALLMLLSLAACGQKAADTHENEAQDTPDAAAPQSAEEAAAPALVGGWTIPEGAALSDEAKAAFEKAMDGLIGVRYEPLALLGTQLVSGTNYCILCEASVAAPDARPYSTLVYVYADLQGGAELQNIVILDIGSIAESGEVQPAEAAPAALMGGWTVDRDSEAQAEGVLLHLASQVVNGTNHCLLCEGAALTFVHTDLDGGSEVIRTVTLDLGALKG